MGKRNIINSLKKVRGAVLPLLILITILMVGCNKDKINTVQEEHKSEKDTLFVPVTQKGGMEKNMKEEVIPLYLEGEQQIITTVQAEEGILTGNVKIETEKSDYIGDGYVTGFHDSGDSCTMTVLIEADGFYDFYFTIASTGGYKSNFVLADGERLGEVEVTEKGFTEVSFDRTYLTKGEHKVTIASHWGYIVLDQLQVKTSKELNKEIYKVSPNLINENATDNTKRLMSYLTDIYGDYFLSGQYGSTGRYGKEFAVIKKATGVVPAILGLDFIEYTPSRVAHGSSGNQTELAIDFWKQGGIVTFCWHWNAPEKYLTKEWYRGFYTEATNIDLKKIMDGQDAEGYRLLLRDIEAIAKELLILQEAEVPILWRPLHEASGGWFWWGNKGAEAFKELYILLYETLTKEYGLNNLIWVWNGQNKDWYPGDEYVDIIGEDIYAGEKVHTSQITRYLRAQEYTDKRKLVYLTENGSLFDPELALRDGAMWGIWCTWGGEFVAKDSAIYMLSEQYTTEEMLKQVYSHKSVLTLEKLPDLTTYPIR